MALDHVWGLGCRTCVQKDSRSAREGTACGRWTSPYTNPVANALIASLGDPPHIFLCRCDRWPSNVRSCSISKPSPTHGAGRLIRLVVDELLGPEPAASDVLDGGVGGAESLHGRWPSGAPTCLGWKSFRRMVEIARSHGIEVEVGAFEDWDAADRTFDRVTSAQAWHWVDLPISTAKRPSSAAARLFVWTAPDVIPTI